MPTCIATAASLSESESNATALKKIRTDQEPQPVANYMCGMAIVQYVPQHSQLTL